MKDKREIRSIAAVRWWFLLFAGAAVLLLLSFYLDASVQAWMSQHQSRGLRDFMRAVSQAGDWPEHLGLGLVLLGLAYWRGSKKWMRVFAAMILACALAGVAARVVKISTGRARPNGTDPGPRPPADLPTLPSEGQRRNTAV